MIGANDIFLTLHDNQNSCLIMKTFVRTAAVVLSATAMVVSCGNSKEERLKAMRDSDSIAQLVREKAIADSLKKDAERIIVDCDYTFEEALEGTKAPQRIIDQLEMLTVVYYSIDSHFHQGQIIVNKAIAEDVKEMFEFMKNEKFPIAKVIPIVAYDWNDEMSMNDNNTSGFNYRNADFSMHANGMAIDINPYFNPQRWKGEWRSRRVDKPRGAVYDTTRPGTFVEGDRIVAEFEKHGFRWGRNMSMKSDDHHFEKHVAGVLTQEEWVAKEKKAAEDKAKQIAAKLLPKKENRLAKPEVTINETSGERIYTKNDEAYELQESKDRMRGLNGKQDEQKMIEREVSVREKLKSGRY